MDACECTCSDCGSSDFHYIGCISMPGSRVEHDFVYIGGAPAGGVEECQSCHVCRFVCDEDETRWWRDV